MNIVKRTVNNLKYAHYRKLRDKALDEMYKHCTDEDPTEWKYWASISVNAMKKCDNIPLH